jgi:type VI secretion system ImpH/TssG family protein
MATTSGEHGTAVDPGNEKIVETPILIPGPKTLLLKKQSLPWEVDPRYAGIAAMLQQEPYRVRFFQAVRLMERIDPKRRPVGLFVTPSAEIVQFSALPTLNFPPSELHSITVDADGHRHMVVQFMGLNAAISVLPTPYTELLLNRIRAKDRGPSDFFDLFNHRLISLFYRGWQKYRFYIALERGAEDALTARYGYGGPRHCWTAASHGYSRRGLPLLRRAARPAQTLRHRLAADPGRLLPHIRTD